MCVTHRHTYQDTDMPKYSLLDHDASTLLEKPNEGSSCSAHQYPVQTKGGFGREKLTIFPPISITLTPSSLALTCPPQSGELVDGNNVMFTPRFLKVNLRVLLRLGKGGKDSEAARV
jgi:hypothetical protein